MSHHLGRLVEPLAGKEKRRYRWRVN